ncbi:MAG: aldo/keto reductase [Lachnospiraceae bacterium]|nr:aldo/keto reductase [Lachnospiraceae bacterium]
MSVLSNCFPLGLGTSRLPIKSAKDTEGIEKSSQLILKALDFGVNYIDTSYPYSGGGAHLALKHAFEQTEKPYTVTVKVIHQSDKTADEARRRVERQFKSLGIDRAAFFVCWCITSYKQFLEIMNKGGVYEGALKLKDEGIIDHICCSLHASMKDSIKIIESGVFAAATISFNFTNAIQTIPILDTAVKHNVDVAIMNPLGGGGIVQNPGFFSFVQANNESVAASALRFAYSHSAVKVVLSGLNNDNELEENHEALTNKTKELDSERLVRVMSGVKSIDGFCVNCHYCNSCHVGIPVSELMSKRNRLLFGSISNQDYRRTNLELNQNIYLFQGQAGEEGSGEWFPESSVNPCIRCGQCETKCTQKLKIIESIDDIYNRTDQCGFSIKARRNRLQELLFEKDYKKVGLYPKDRFADMVMKLYERFFGTPDFEWVTFNSDSSMWGRVIDGLKVDAPHDILLIRPDIIIVCNYTYETEIYNDLKKYEADGIKIVKLHREADVPWVF